MWLGPAVAGWGVCAVCGVGHRARAPGLISVLDPGLAPGSGT
jgi:hypothetical protein